MKILYKHTQRLAYDICGFIYVCVFESSIPLQLEHDTELKQEAVKWL